MTRNTIALTLALSICSGIAWADVTSLNQTGALNLFPWADGDWYLVAIQVDNIGNPVGTLSAELMMTLATGAPEIDPY